MIYEKSCGAVIYTMGQSGPLFLIETMQKGHISICKGHVEAGEDEHQTARREIAEETGLSVLFQDGFRESIAYSPYEDCLKTVIFFLARTDTMEVTPQEAEVREIDWLPLEQALSRLTFQSDREVLSKAAQFIQNKL